MEETYQLIEGSPTLRDLDAENGFLWCPFGHSGRQNEPGILISRLDDGSYDVRLGTGFDSPERFATGDPDWSWRDLSVASTVELTFADDMALNDWIAVETTATGAAWARCFNPYCGPDEKTLNTSEIIDTLRRFESPSYIVRGPIEDIESLPVGYYWCPDALDPDPSYNGYLLNVFAGFDGRGLPGKFFELFGGVTLNDVPSFGFDDGWDGSCLNRLDWFEDAAGMDADGLSAGLVANDAESIKAPVGETCGADCLFACHVDIDGIYAERTGDPDGLRAYCDPMGVGWNYGPIYYFPRESIEQVVGQLCEDGDDFPVLFDGERVIEAFDGTPVHMSVPVEVDGEKVWTCGYDFCWCETVAPDFSRARGHFPDATVAAWAAARNVNQSDGDLGLKERM